MRRQDSCGLGAFVLATLMLSCKPAAPLVEADESLARDAIQFAEVSATQWTHDKVSLASHAERMSLQQLQELNADKASFTITSERGDVVRVSGLIMQSDLPSGDISLAGEVILRRGPVSLHADKLDYRAQARVAQTSAGVTVRGGDFTMTSTSAARWDEKKNEVRIDGPVRLLTR